MASQSRFRTHLFIIVVLVFTFACDILGGEPQLTSEVPAETPSEMMVEDTSPPLEPEVPLDSVEINSLNAYSDVFDEWVIYGLITNVADFPVGPVGIEFEFFNSASDSVLQKIFYDGFDGIAPGGTMPFVAYVMESLTDVADYDAAVIDLDKIDLEYVSVETLGSSMVITESGVVRVSGEIFNPNDQPVMLDQTRAAVYTADGNILMVEACDVCARYLEAGESGSFRVLLFGAPLEMGVPVDYEIFSSASITEPIDTFDIEIIPSNYQYTDGVNWFHLLGEVVNNSQENLAIYLLGTLYDAEDNVIDAASYEVEPLILLPGESAPYDLRFGGPSTEAISPEKISRWEVELDLSQTGAFPLELIKLSSEDVEVTYAPGFGIFNGTIVNNSGETLEAVTIVITLRNNATGDIVGVGNTTIIEEIPDGDFVPYEIFISLEPEYNNNLIDYELVVIGG